VLVAQRPAAPDDQRYDWDYLVGISGEAGREWMAEYARPEHAAIAQGTDRALALFRGRMFDPGYEALRLAGARLAELRGSRASIVSVLERWYHGVAAYYYYCVDDMPSAQGGLLRADQAVRDAIGADRFLLPLAHHCHEFQLHHARIARNLRLWPEMGRHIAIVRAMVEGRLPLCELRDGAKVDYAAIARLCASLPLNDEAQRALSAFADAALRRRHLERFVLELYTLPGFLIPYSAARGPG
jgi:hypothetical protein